MNIKMKKNLIIIVIAIISILILSFLLKEKDILVENILIENPTSELIYGNEFSFNPIIKPENASNKNIIWKSSNENLVKIDKEGNIKVIGNEDSEVTITLKSVDGNYTSKIKINTKKIEELIKVEGITIKENNLTLKYGESKKIIAIVKPENASNKNVIWESSNENLVKIDKEGNIKVIANQDGEVIITAKTEEGNFESKIKINTKKIEELIKVEGITIKENNLTLKYGESKKINVVVKPENASNKNIIWESSNENLVKIDKEGNIKVIGNEDSEVIITAKTEEGNYNSTVKVITKKIEELINVTNISFDKTKIELEKGKTTQLTPIITPINATNKNVVWTSENSNIAYVSNNGIVTANSVGTTKITAKIGDLESSIIVVVKDTTKPTQTPKLVITTESDNYTIETSSSNISEKYYSNDKKVTINIAKTEDVVKYAYVIATTQEEALKKEKTIVNINEPIKLNLTDSSWNVYYIWGVDSNNNYSKPFVRLAVKYEKIFLQQSDYKCLPHNNNAELYGENCYSSIKKTGSTFDNYKEEQKALITRYLNYKIEKQGTNKRNATVEAARFLVGEFNTKIEYVSNNFYLKKGLNFNNSTNCWNCNNGQYGLQCSGYVSWALINGGYTKVANYGVLPGALILSGYMSPYDYAKMYGKDTTKVTDKNLIVSKSNIIDVNSNVPWSKVKAGDIVGYTGNLVDGKYSGGHVGIIIKIDSTYVYIAHNAKWSGYKNGIDGLQITRYKKTDYHKNDKFGKGKIVLMDEIYNE